MPYLDSADLKTHIYQEQLDEIIRTDNNIVVAAAIAEAIAEAKSYMSRWDLGKLFGVDNGDPEVQDEHLKSRVKDLVIWRLVRLANPNISMELARTNYEDAVKWFRDLQKGNADPEGWPYKPADQVAPVMQGGAVSYSSNRKRNNHF